MMRRWAMVVGAIVCLALAGAGIAAALPQQQGSVDLLNQANGQWDGPGEAQGGSNAGQSVAGLGDIFHDGRSALAIGAPEANPGGRISAGSVYVVAGQPGSSVVDLTALTGRGYRIDGADAGDQLGFSLAALELANGDPGLAIGAPYANPKGRIGAGLIYVIDLRRLHSNVDLSNTPPNRAVVAVITGPAACAESGYALAAAGLRAGGKVQALIDGAPGVDPTGCAQEKAGGPVGGNTGAAYVIFNPNRSLDLAGAGRAISELKGVATGDRAGSAVAAAGSPGAFMIGAPYASPLARAGAGAVYLIHGATPGRVVSLASPPAGSTTFEGAVANAALGFAMSSTTDFAKGQRGGAVDLALGAPQASPKGRTEAGEIYLVAATREPAHVDLAAAGTPGFRGGVIDGGEQGDEAGYSLAGVGSLNGDGVPDLAIGAPFANSQTGQDRLDNGAAYVLYGGAGRFDIDLSHMRSRGFAAYGARNSDEAGTAVAPIADEAGDGKPDVLIGAPFAENMFGATPTEGGAVYAVLGWGRPALRYGVSSLIATVGHAIRPLVPGIRATGRPSFSISPALPRGLRLNPRTGTISGTPRARSALGAYTVQLTDLAGVADATLLLEVRR